MASASLRASPKSTINDLRYSSGGRERVKQNWFGSLLSKPDKTKVAKSINCKCLEFSPTKLYQVPHINIEKPFFFSYINVLSSRPWPSEVLTAGRACQGCGSFPPLNRKLLVRSLQRFRRNYTSSSTSSCFKSIISSHCLAPY